VDPGVFVADASVTAGGIGLEGIDHVAGLRPLRLADRDVPLYTAEGAGLAFTAGKWLAATGSAAISAQGVALRFQRLIAFGVYSTFKVSVSGGALFAPLDGEGTRNSFQADPEGTGTLAIALAQPLESHTVLAVIYHSDGRVHGTQPGRMGWTAHQQLVAAIP
jgi:hypothetical protein